MARSPRRRSSLHSTSKSVEADLLREARALAEDPSKIVPHCEGSCPLFCPARKARKRIPRIQAAHENEGKLQKFAHRERNPLARAYAATLQVANAGKAPVVAELRTPRGSVPYVMRGKALPLPLVGVQHASEPGLRILAFTPFVKRNRYHFYATPDGIVCTHKRADPPEAFVHAARENLQLDAHEDRWTCTHGGCDTTDDVLVLDWHTAGVRIELCAECAGDRNTVQHVLRHATGPNPPGEFRVRVRYAPLTAAAGDAPEPLGEVEPPNAVEYAKGGFTDEGILEKAREHRATLLKERAGFLLVIGTTSYGTDADAFIHALDPLDAEQRALAAALDNLTTPIVLTKASVARALHQVWQERGQAALEAAAGSADVAHDLYDPDAGVSEIQETLQKAASRGGEARVNAELPTYASLPGPANVADAIAREYRIRGRDDAVRLALQKSRETRERAVALGFLLALGEGGGEDWRFKHAEREMAQDLQESARKLLDVSGSEYHDVLDHLNRRAGSVEPLEPA